VRVKSTNRALAMSVDGNGRYCYLDPFEGARLAVAEAARNVACAGGLPVGATNNLNFGNPQKPEIMWQFVEAVRGIGDACRALEIPITGGNVSLYNETDGTAILPTPVLGVVGVIEDATRVIGRSFRERGHAVVLLGTSADELGGSEYLYTVHGTLGGVPPKLDIDAERRLQLLLVSAAQDGVIASAHDCAEGGLGVTLAECAFDTGGIGADVDVAGVDASHALRTEATLFGESASRAIVSVEPEQVAVLLDRAKDHGVPAAVIGTTGGATLRIRVDGKTAIDVSVSEAEEAWETAIESYFERRTVASA
jgi:phosphoribosylformylglycinamidine synthase